MLTKNRDFWGNYMFDNLTNKPSQSNFIELFMIDRSWDPKAKVVSK